MAEDQRALVLRRLLVSAPRGRSTNSSWYTTWRWPPSV